MSKQARRRQHRHSAPPRNPHPGGPGFDPVPTRPRHDGWTPARQVAFIRSLAATGTVEEACAAVGMSPRAYYTLRARPDAASFRQAVDAALDLGVHRIAEAMLGRALHGEATPIFYQGEQIGERRRFDNKLAMFVLRTRAPDRYGKWRDGIRYQRGHPDGAAQVFGAALKNLADDAAADAASRPRPVRAPLRAEANMDDPEVAGEFQHARERAADARAAASRAAYQRTLDRLASIDDPAADDGRTDWDDEEEDGGYDGEEE